jgi:hypothetical protein
LKPIEFFLGRPEPPLLFFDETDPERDAAGKGSIEEDSSSSQWEKNEIVNGLQGFRTKHFFV